MNKLLFYLLAMLFAQAALAQTDSTHTRTDTALAHTDTTAHRLNEVTVKAYGENHTLLQTAAAVNVISKETIDMQAFAYTSILPVVNATPGVRMEERSPDSYRFGIRGSSLESPFGVRNVKVYYNDIPFTDPGGNTYLNQLGIANIGSIEIIKGPGSSLYGAGTGGVLLLSSNMPTRNSVSAGYTGGSYGLSNEWVQAAFGDSVLRNVIRYQHINSDGYRQQSQSSKDVISWDAVMKHSSKSELSAHFFYGNLYYQTPGGLTLAEYNANPAMARPTTPGGPGAIAADAAIFQKTFLAGFTYTQHFTDNWSNATTLYGDYSQQYNPNLRNYSRTSEPNFGGRTSLDYRKWWGPNNLYWSLGAEAQQGFMQDHTYNNVNGNPQALQSDQGLNTRQVFGFTQLSVRRHRWLFTAGASVDQMYIDLNSPMANTYTDQSRTFNNQVAPRAAILYGLNDVTSIYVTASRGFSPPTAAELAPTGSAVNFGLNAEHGWNYEAGIRGYSVHGRLYYDVSMFYFALQNAIVERRDSLGGDYYVNAGSTMQNGIEAYLDYKLFKSGYNFIRFCDIYGSYTGYHFIYDKFVDLAGDYSGNQMPGVAPTTIALGTTLHSRYNVYLGINYFYSSKIAMDDANTQYANAYSLLSAKLGYRKDAHHYFYDIFLGIDNALNQKYSLGNDINAVNARYYNAAPGVNYFAGVSLGVN